MTSLLERWGNDALRGRFLSRMVDAIELRNPSYAGRVRASRAVWLNRNVLRIAETGSSDAHHAALLGHEDAAIGRESARRHIAAGTRFE